MMTKKMMPIELLKIEDGNLERDEIENKKKLRFSWMLNKYYLEKLSFEINEKPSSKFSFRKMFVYLFYNTLTFYSSLDIF